MNYLQRVTVLGVLGLSLTACGGNGTGATNDAPESTTATVKALASTTSETDTPFDVNGGAFGFNDTSETSAPRSINN